MVRDLRFAARALRRSAGFTAAAVVTLALGIGATTTVFSVVYGILYRPLPFPNADRLVQIVQVVPARGGGQPSRSGLSTGQVSEWRATSRTLAAIGHYMPASAALTDVPTPVRLNGASVSVPLFRALGVAPLEGRLFADEEELAGSTNVAILSYRLWKTQFGGGRVLDKPIALNGVSRRVVGVMPQGFGFPSIASPFMSLNSTGQLDGAPEYWVPRAADARPPGPETRGMTLRQTLALLAPGATIEEATAEAATLMQAHVRERFPIEIVSPSQEQARDVRPVLLLFQAAVACVFFIACVNVVNLLLARAASRGQDLSIRVALGASRLQIMRYAVAEAVLLGVAGGVLGCALAFFVVGFVRMLPPYILPRLAEIRVDVTVLAFAAALSLGAGLLVGLVTGVRVLRSASGPYGLSSTQRGISRHRTPRALIVAETAAGTIVLTGAGLLLTSFVNLTNVGRGFETDGVFTFQVALPPRYQDAAAHAAFHDALRDQLRQTTGVTSVGVSEGMVGAWSTGFALSIDGTRVPNAAVGFQAVTPGVFGTLRIPLRGRDFTGTDRLQNAQTIIVNETFARQFFPGRDPVGQRIDFQDWKGLEIIGVAADTRTRELTRAVSPAVYLPQELKASGFPAPTYFVRTTQMGGLAEIVRGLAARQERDAVIYDALPMNVSLARTVATPRVYSATATGFAAVAVTLAALGLFGVLSYSIRARTREFGIRLALGAPARRIIASVMGEALGTVLIGLVAGLAGALYLSRFLETLLFGVRPRDPVTLVTVAFLFMTVAAIAAYVPARRATRVDPLVALRTE